MSWRYVDHHRRSPLYYELGNGHLYRGSNKYYTPSYYSTHSSSSPSSSSTLNHRSSSSYSSSIPLRTPTTLLDLQEVLHTMRPLPRLRRREPTIYDVDCDEVHPKLYVGDAASAKNKNFLRSMGITHVLNTAEGSRIGQVDTGHLYYRDMSNVRYMGFPLIDQASTDISRYFYIASKFIENGINSGGKVLVHCLMGVSRSATCAIVYLMIAKKMSAAEAIRQVRLYREIRPNDGFLQQIADLDNELRRERLYSY